MKYIRTKDGIFELIWVVVGKNGKQFIIEKYDGAIYEEEIIAQADTIEELCDEFVVVYKDSEPYLTQHLSYAEMEEYNLRVNGNNGIIYGAIWTDKGLIYVAKMNDKGELELL